MRAASPPSWRAAGRRPSRKRTTLHWLRLGDFVPASDTLLRRELLPEAEKALGLKITMETINGNDLQARITSSIQSGSGADIIHAMHNWPQLYAESLVDVSDVAEEIAKDQGGYYDIFPRMAKGERGWLAVPWCALGILLCYRKSWFDEIGVTKFPDTWESYRAAGKLLKAKGRPIGQTLGHAYNDAPAFTYPYLWSWGGKELEADGKTVALNSKETLESVKFMAGFWKDAHDEGGLAWDDSNNNRAFLGGTISATSNAASIYIEALRKPEQYRTEKGAPLKDDILHAPYPKGPGGRRRPASAADPHADGLFEEPEGREGFPALGAFAARVREMVHIAKGLFDSGDARMVEARAVERGPRDGAVPRRDPDGARSRLAGPVGPQGGGGRVEVHHHRHVREGRARHAARGRREVGGRRAEEDLQPESEAIQLCRDGWIASSLTLLAMTNCSDLRERAAARAALNHTPRMPQAGILLCR